MINKTDELRRHTESVNRSLQQIPRDSKSPIDPEMIFLKNRVKTNLLINKTPKQESNDHSLIAGPRRGGRLKLPKIREKLTLHITDNGTEILDEKR